MTNQIDIRQAAKDITYASAMQTRGGRTVVRVMENLSGRHRLIRRAKGCQQRLNDGENFWRVMTEAYGLDLEVIRGSLSNIPAKGPVTRECAA